MEILLTEPGSETTIVDFVSTAVSTIVSTVISTAWAILGGDADGCSGP